MSRLITVFVFLWSGLATADPLEKARQQYLDGAVLDAIESLRYAQHQLHRNDGVWSLSQLDAMSLLLEIHKDQQNIDEVINTARFLFHLRSRNATSAAEKVDAHRLLAKELVELKFYDRAVKEYRAGLTLTSTDDERAELLIGIATTRLAQGGIFNEGIEAMLEANDLGLTNDTAKLVQLYLADLYQVSGNTDSASRIYTQLWQDLHDAQRYEWFGKPRLLYPNHQPGRLITDSASSFSIDEEGRPSRRDVNALANELHYSTRAWLKQGIYRPHIVGGELLPAQVFLRDLGP